VRENRKHGSMERDRRILPFTLPKNIVEMVFRFRKLRVVCIVKIGVTGWALNVKVNGSQR